jgi:O-antigen ligase
MTVLCLLSALATASKGAAALLLGALSVLALLVCRGWRQRTAVLAGILVFATLVGVGARFLHLGDRIQEFVESTGGQVSEVDRLVTWRASTAMLRDFPLTGSGFGSFPDVFPAYQPAGEYKRWNKVHNDYLEVLLEGGAIAGFLLLWLMWNYWRRAVGVFRRQPGTPRDYATIGLVLGLVALSLHALFDFNHQIPANALLFTTLAAMAVAARESSTPAGER